jgi:hypothetical protein
LLVLRRLHPGCHIVGCHAGQLHRLGQRAGLGPGAAHELVQGQLLHAQVVVGGDFLGAHQVVAGLRLARVGDGGGAHLEVAFGGGELLRHGGLLRLHEGEGVLRSQHIKVGLADAHQQVLCGGVELRPGHVDATLALLVANAVGRAVQRLRGADGHALRGAVVIDGGAADVGVGARNPGGQPRTGQQAGACLVGAAGCGFELGLRRLPGRVIAPSGLDKLQQALGLRRGGKRGAQRQGQDQRAKPERLHGEGLSGSA